MSAAMESVAKPENPHGPGLAAQFGIAALVGVALALTGAFGTETFPLVWRFVYWICGLIFAGLALRVLAIPMRSVCAMVGIGPHWAFLLAVPLLGASLLLAFALSGGMPGTSQTTMFWQSVSLGAALFVLFGALHWVGDKRTTEPPPVASPSLPTDTALHAHLPQDFGAIHALTVEDHYVSVLGDGRREMLLMNLSEAIALLGPAAGLQTHRSWWVARAAIDRIEREGRNTRLRLIDGTSAPVSRANVAQAKALLES